MLLHGRVASSLWSCSWVVKGSEIGDCGGGYLARASEGVAGCPGCPVA